MSRRILTYLNNEKIIRSGESQQRMYIILDGMVNITLSDGTQKIQVAELKKGDFFGEMTIFNNKPRSANATAIGEVKVAYIDDPNQLKAFLIKNPSFAAKMVNVLALRLAKTDELLIGKVNEINRLKILGEV